LFPEKGLNIHSHSKTFCVHVFSARRYDGVTVYTISGRISKFS